MFDFDAGKADWTLLQFTCGNNLTDEERVKETSDHHLYSLLSKQEKKGFCPSQGIGAFTTPPPPQKMHSCLFTSLSKEIRQHLPLQQEGNDRK